MYCMKKQQCETRRLLTMLVITHTEHRFRWWIQDYYPDDFFCGGEGG